MLHPDLPVRSPRLAFGALCPACLWALLASLAFLAGCSINVGVDGTPDGSVGADATVRTGPYDECGNGMDDDGDGQIDEACFCAGGETQPCFSGMYPNRGIGACGDGVQMCDAASGTEFGHWGACLMDTLPVEEACDEVDNDCDGAIDEGCSCSEGETRACATDFSRAPCAPGTQTCGSDGSWSGCEGAIGPSAESCGEGAGDGIDNDCDGTADEGCACVPRPEVCEDGRDNDCDGTIDEPACGATPGDACAGVDCNTGGICAVAAGEPICVCGTGFRPAGRTTCVSDSEPVVRGCSRDDDCPGELCDFESGACLPETPERCVLPPPLMGADPGTEPKAEGEACIVRVLTGISTAIDCDTGLVCVGINRLYDATTGEYELRTDGVGGICQRECNPCDGCGDATCLLLPDGGGFCASARAVVEEGGVCRDTTGSLGSCTTGTGCLRTGSFGAPSICVAHCIPDDLAFARESSPPFRTASASADCAADEHCTASLVSDVGHLFTCAPGLLTSTGQACGLRASGQCEYPERCQNVQAYGYEIPGVCSLDEPCDATSCPTGTHCRATDSGLASMGRVCIGENALSRGALCEVDLDCETGLSCQQYGSSPEVFACR